MTFRTFLTFYCKDSLELVKAIRVMILNILDIRVDSGKPGIPGGYATVLFILKPIKEVCHYISGQNGKGEFLQWNTSMG